jgi:hypothetical protein
MFPVWGIETDWLCGKCGRPVPPRFFLFPVPCFPVPTVHLFLGQITAHLSVLSICPILSVCLCCPLINHAAICCWLCELSVLPCINDHTNYLSSTVSVAWLRNIMCWIVMLLMSNPLTWVNYWAYLVFYCFISMDTCALISLLMYQYYKLRWRERYQIFSMYLIRPLQYVFGEVLPSCVFWEWMTYVTYT